MKKNTFQRIAVLMTCHNRKDKTLTCLQELIASHAKYNIDMTIYLVDDGSCDGTGSVVKAEYPAVKVIEGDGSLYWNGGMRVAFAAAMRKSYDYYLWLNDDTYLHPDALSVLFSAMDQVEELGGEGVIMCGSTVDPHNNKLSYGGYRLIKKRFYSELVRLKPNGSLLSCDTMNGNCVLISRAAAHCVGNLDPVFTHSMGDLDYGFRAVNMGCSIWLAPKVVADCQNNIGVGSWRDARLPLYIRWKKLIGPLGLPPSEWFVYVRRYSGRLWPFLWVLPYFKFCLKAIINLPLNRRI